MRRAHVFDMDGTLLHGTSAPLLLAAALGETDALHDLERRFADGSATAVDFARALHAMWGIVPDAAIASGFPRDTETPLDPERILNPALKPVLARAFCEEHGLQLQDAVAYGDSMSDVHLFDAVAIRIAVNADHHLAGRSDVAVDGADLLPAYEAARRLAG